MEHYFNYFTEIERYYQTKRESFTLLSSLDWVLVEMWKQQGIPLDVVLKGIDRAFAEAKRPIGRLAYCAGAVAAVMEEQKDLKTDAPAPPEFKAEEIKTYLGELARQVRELGSTFPEFAARFDGIADAVGQLDVSDLRTGETALTALEEKLIAIVKIAASDDALVQVRNAVERTLAPVRSRMTAEQLAMLEQQLWKRKLMERYDAPRLSLFYMV